MYARVCVVRAEMLVILFDVGEIEQKKNFQSKSMCKKNDVEGEGGREGRKKIGCKYNRKRNKEFVQMHIHRHLCSPSRPSFVASELLTLSSAHLLNQTSRQYPHLDMYVDCETRRRRKKKFINGNNLRSPVQIDFERKNEGENIERASFD